MSPDRDQTMGAGPVRRRTIMKAGWTFLGPCAAGILVPAFMISLGSTFFFAQGGLLAQEAPSRGRIPPPDALPTGEAAVTQPPQQGPVRAPGIAERVTAPDGPVLGEAKLVTTAAWTQPAQPLAGKQITVQAQLVNQGALPSQEGLGFLVVCDETPGGPSCPSKSPFSSTLPSIAPGKTKSVSVLLDAVWSPGKYRLVAGTDVIFLNDAVDLELVVGSNPSGTPSAINLKPESVFITKSPKSSDVTAQVPSGDAVKIWCPVRVDGTAYQQFYEDVVYWGDPAWVLDAYNTSGYLTFGSTLKVALIVGKQTATVASITKLGLNPASLEDAPHAPPNYISYSFQNNGIHHMVSVDWVFADEGQHTLRCTVDAGHSVKETNEGDNQVTSTVQVGLVKQDVQPKPTAAPAPIQLPPPPVSRNGPIAASARVSTPNEPAASREYDAPTWKGKRVDWCLIWGGQCGEPAATEFCKRSGYAKASGWKPADDIGAQTPTVVLSSGQVCSDASCDGFASITCTK